MYICIHVHTEHEPVHAGSSTLLAGSQPGDRRLQSYWPGVADRWTGATGATGATGGQVIHKLGKYQLKGKKI